MKTKKLKPSHRENKRYILFSGEKKDVEQAILDYVGILGYAKSGVTFAKNNILAVNREELDKIRASFLLSGRLKIIRVSGTLKGLSSKS